MPFKLFAFFWLLPQVFLGQNFLIEGRIVGADNLPLTYVNVVLTSEESPHGITGTTTDDNGVFKIENISEGTYGLIISMIGYSTVNMTLTLPDEKNLGSIILEEEAEGLEEVTLSVAKPSIQKTAGKLIFNVENSSLSIGNTLNLLSKTPGVIVLGESISIKNRPTTVYLNGRRVYLSKSEMNAFLLNLDASIIKSVEVITNPSSEFDAESGTVINIITSKAIAPGYKGTISGNYEQAIFSKYNLGTSHFFKNNWLNLFGSYSYSPRKENKDQDSYIRYTKANPSLTEAFWESDFNRITRSYGHQANLVANIDFDDKNALNLTANVSLMPDKEYQNFQNTSIYNAQRQLDSTFITKSEVNINTNNLLFGADYKTALNSEGGTITVGTNYITYTNDQEQQLKSDYYLPNGDFLKTIQFDTDSNQDTEIITGHFDLKSPLWAGNFEAGLKYSHIETKSGLDFYDIVNGTTQFNANLSDIFTYQEAIYATYVNFDKEIEKWHVSLGMRGEYTDVSGISETLGSVNTQEYFQLFPAVSFEYKWNENNSAGASYARKIDRPRYQSLNPFRYFINENNFNVGNPNLVPAIEDKITLSYSHKEKWFLELYYQHIDNSLEILNFQDNENFTLRQLDANMVDYFQYSMDVVYSSSLTDWWFANYISSCYYLENEFFALESAQETYINNTFGFYGQLYNQFTLTEDGTFTSELTASYVSNLISGSLDYNNIFNLSLSFRKSLWNKSAIISTGVNDMFNTNNVPVTSRYLNQDNSYFAMPESRKFWIGFQYNFGNYTLREHKKNIQTQEGDRLQ